jgi:hypothetical protein
MHPETRQIIVEAPHYLFDNWNSLEELIRYVRRFRLSPFRNK